MHVMVIGNKTDKPRAVSAEEGKALADKLGLPYAECNIFDEASVKAAFARLIEDSYKHSNAAKEAEKPVCLISIYFFISSLLCFLFHLISFSFSFFSTKKQEDKVPPKQKDKESTGCACSLQ